MPRVGGQEEAPRMLASRARRDETRRDETERDHRRPVSVRRQLRESSGMRAVEALRRLASVVASTEHPRGRPRRLESTAMTTPNPAPGLHRGTKLFDGTIALPGDSSSTGADLSFDVIAFGRGDRTLLILPGLSDGLTMLRGKGRAMAWYYRKLPSRYRVYLIGRPRELPDPYSTREMAADYAALSSVLGFAAGTIDLWGLSQGGMIAQWMAIDHGALLRRLAITVSTARPTATLTEVVGGWMELARAGRYGQLLKDTAEKTYRKPRLIDSLFLPVISRLAKPASFDRFLIQAQACLTHDAYDELPSITTPTLIVGGARDRVVGTGTSELLAERIPGAELRLYPQLGHGAYEEAPDLSDAVMRFFAHEGLSPKRAA